MIHDGLSTNNQSTRVFIISNKLHNLIFFVLFSSFDEFFIPM
jgi:hypothetical protein